jgi:LPS-assembly protein
VRAERIDLEQGTQNLTATGPVRLSRSGHVFSGQALDLRIDTFEGFFAKPQFRFRSGGQGQAERFEFLGDQRMSAVSASYTTCERDNDESWKPAWEFTAERLDFDLTPRLAKPSICGCAFRTPPFCPGPAR